ncbi:MAG: indole-3-glycerol phosphate synthase TrpC [Chloroflexi bacterium]|nr:indole-3-glycerol phosphate synthase TrpC [Chloroflexota bacterium]
MILDAILANTRRELEERKQRVPLSELARAASDARAPLAFAPALRAPGVSIIAEVKRRSPSGGEIRPGASAADLAAMYARGGASAISVLTDSRYFGGSAEDLVAAKHTADLPTLRKDFIVDPYQVYEARAMGADAVLLIVRALAAAELRDLLALTHDFGFAALVETHNASEVEAALDAGAEIVGVNNRDLDTLVTDVSLAPKLRRLVPADRVFVAESGISQPDQIAALARENVDAVLIGESLLRSDDPPGKLQALVAAGAPARAGR